MQDARRQCILKLPGFPSTKTNRVSKKNKNAEIVDFRNWTSELSASKAQRLLLSCILFPRIQSAEIPVLSYYLSKAMSIGGTKE